MKNLKMIDASKNKTQSSSFSILFYLHKDFEKIKKSLSLPNDLLKKFEFEKNDLFKWVVHHHAHQKVTGYFIFKEELSTFSLHESLRKALPMDVLIDETIQLDFSFLSASKQPLLLNAMGNLFALSQFKPETFGKKSTPKKKTESLTITFKSEDFSKSKLMFEEGYREGEASNLVRELSELPGNILQPKHYIEKVKKVMSGLKLNTHFFNQKELQKRGANAFLSVVRANPADPYGILKLHYKPKNSKKKIALVGKGLCFDTGGYNIKTGDHMFDMHRDMTGSAVVLALTKLLVEENAPFEIETYMALAENLISPTAYRPNDVVIASNGISIEVVDTDAEGRMVLADTLVMASENKPDLIIDYATLTGSVIRALGTGRSGVYSNQESLRELAVAAGNEVGERVWGFPIGEDYNKGIESEIADVRQCGKGNFCDHIYASTFLSRFIENNVPWLHVDLAAENNAGGLGLSARDITGFGVRLGKQIIHHFVKR